MISKKLPGSVIIKLSTENISNNLTLTLSKAPTVYTQVLPAGVSDLVAHSGAITNKLKMWLICQSVILLKIMLKIYHIKYAIS